MFLHRWWVRALPAGKALPGRRRLAVIGIALVLGANSSARSDIRQQPTGEVDSEHIFGFTEGSDIGAAGELELLADTTGHFGKFSGTYWQTATTLEAKHSLTESFRVSATATFSYFDLSGLRDLDDRRKGAFQSLSFSTRYRLLDRAHAPIGLTFGVEPHWGFVDDLSGAPASQLGAEFLVLMDRELIPGRLLGAVNLSYEPEQIRPRGVAEVTRDSTLNLDAALAVRAASGVYIGAEVRYLRRFDGFGFSGTLGQVLYAGPTVYATFGNEFFFSATWNAQIWGAATGSPAALDLVNFDRFRVKVRAGFNF